MLTLLPWPAVSNALSIVLSVACSFLLYPMLLACFLAQTERANDRHSTLRLANLHTYWETGECGQERVSAAALLQAYFRMKRLEKQLQFSRHEKGKVRPSISHFAFYKKTVKAMKVQMAKFNH